MTDLKLSSLAAQIKDLATQMSDILSEDAKLEFNSSNFLDDPKWEVAVDPILLVQSEEDKKIRAESIIFLFMGEDQNNVSFLDVGCEDGYIADLIASKNAKISVGYDINKNNNWRKNNFSRPNLFYSDNFEEIKEKGPYDKILLYDILDHERNPVETLKQLKPLIKPNGEVNVRCHPWCSRHGGHLYRIKNKAYLHLILTDEEIASLGGEPPIFTNKIIHPQNTYSKWFEDAGYKIATMDLVTDEVPPFFYENPIISLIIKKNWINSTNSHLASGKLFPRYQLSQSFIDYKLTVN